MAKLKKISKDEKAFCKHYMTTRNQLETKMQLGYDVDLGKRVVREYLQSKAVPSEFAVPKDPILRTLYAIATFDHLAMYDKDGDVKPLRCLTDEQRMALKTYSERDSGTTFTTHSKEKALDAIMKHLGLFEKDNSQKVDKHEVALNFNDMYGPRGTE